jgi:excreted virulence factor EspC (type VII ESX diderm)
MGDRYTVDPAELRKHAGDIDSLRERFAAVKAASAHIAQDDQAYGMLCGWISGILEGRHTKQDELIAYVEENLDIVARELRETADDYEARDANTAEVMNRIKDGMPE